MLNYFQLFLLRAVKANVKFEKENKQKLSFKIQFRLFIL